MTATDYKKKHIFMVYKLAKNPSEILASLDPRKCHLQHMAIGLLDEYFELEIAKLNQDKENILEELGDMLFYTEGLIKDYAYCLEPHRVKPLTRPATFQLLGRLVKRNSFYEQELNIEDLIQVYANLIEWIKYDASHIGKTIVDVQIHNMEKLAKRYPNFDYSDERATVRADKTYKVICIDNATKEETTEAKSLTKEQADLMIKKLNDAMPENEPFTFKAEEEI